VKEETKMIVLPTKLYNRLEERARLSGFDSTNEYVIFVLEEITNEEEKAEHVAISKAEDESIRRGLRELGYLD
jgi:hypothetical protein